MNKIHANSWAQIWEERAFVPIDIEGKISTWQQLAWKVGLEFLGEIYKKAKTGNLVLECGCGSANDSLFLAKRGYKTIMLDNSFEAIMHAKRNFLYFKAQGAYVMGDVQKLPFKDNLFDIVTSGGLLEHFKDIIPSIKEMVRILKPRGLFVTTIRTKRFSIQTVGNIEGFSVRFLKRLFMLRFKNIIKESLMKPRCYENSVIKKTYEYTLKEEGLENVKITGVGPFPDIALPRPIESIYVRILQKMPWFWKWFDRCELKFTDWWGTSWYAWGFKKQ